MNFPDVSSYQGAVNMKAVREAGAQLVGIKATEGRTINDSRCRSNIDNARKAGIAPMVYHFAHPENNSATDEVNHLLSVTGGPRNNDLPHVLDYEPQAGGSDGWVSAWVELYLKRTGHRPIIYGGNGLREQGIRPHGCRLWLAAYTKDWKPWVPRGWDPPVAWQYTESGRFAGVSGSCDVNRWLASPETLAGLRLGQDDPLETLTAAERKDVKRLQQYRANAKKRGEWIDSERNAADRIKDRLKERIRKLREFSDKELKEENRRERLAILRDAVANRKLEV